MLRLVSHFARSKSEGSIGCFMTAVGIGIAFAFTLAFAVGLCSLAGAVHRRAFEHHTLDTWSRILSQVTY